MNRQTQRLALDQVTKLFNGHKVVDNVSLSVAAGEIIGFLGPNGAGKTTTIKMIAGLLRPEQGSIRINGRFLADEPLFCKQVTGYIPDRPYLYEKLSGHEYLAFIAGLYDLEPALFQERSQRLLEMFDLSPWANSHLIEAYSHGMRQKLVFASVLMLDPLLLVIDEPMVGLDPKSTRLVKGLIRDQARRGSGVFLSTHSLEVAEELCDRIIIINHGRLIESGTIEQLRQKAAQPDSNLEEIFLTVTGSTGPDQRAATIIKQDET